MSLYDKALEKMSRRLVWKQGERVPLWQGTVQGQTARIYLKRDGGYVGMYFSLGTLEWRKPFTGKSV